MTLLLIFGRSHSSLVGITDLGYMINYAMFQRNGRSGYVLKPEAIRLAQKDLLAKRTDHVFRVKIISGQQLPRPKDVFARLVRSSIRTWR